MLNEFVYCPRLFYLEWVQAEWAESAETVSGKRTHRNVDKETGRLPGPKDLNDTTVEVRSLLLSAPQEGLIARLDLLEGDDGQVVPVEYKRGKVPGQGIWDADEAQLCAQALVLRENGYRCEEAVAYYAASKQRVRLAITEELVERTRNRARQARAVAEGEELPAPLVDSPKCPRCSLVGICLPDEQNLLTTATEEEPTPVRLLYPARDDALPVYVQSQGTRVGLTGDQLEVRPIEGPSRRVRLIDISQLALFGNVQVSSNLMSELMARGIPICHFSYGGWFKGITHGLGSKNCEVRLEQYRAVTTEAACLSLARGFVVRKLKNCRTLLRRNSHEESEATLRELARYAKLASEAQSFESLLGLEGMGAKHYFRAFPSMLKAPGGEAPTFEFNGRNRRPPRDPINAILSLAYSALSRDWTVALLSVGFDPYLGLFHRPRFGRPSLALDMMEEFRPLIADSVVLQLVNNGELRPSSFISRGGAVSLTSDGRKRFFAAYERRMAHLVRHPLFGYRVSYRRLLEVQARLLARHLSGELKSYDGFLTR
jgi:CRISP-associated protein Cas1